MRNQYPGTCYRCGLHCEAGAGHFERIGRGWRVQHAECAIKFRGQPDAARLADLAEKEARLAKRDLWTVENLTGRRRRNALRRIKARQAGER